MDNFVLFDCSHYSQLMGGGTIYAPFYANVFMTNFEAKHTYPCIKEMSLLYLRYIDDIFMIWTGTKGELMAFITEPNEKQNYQIWLPNFTKKNCNSWLTVYKDEYNNIQTTFYRKSTDEKVFLNANSEHLGSLKSSTLCIQTLKTKNNLLYNYRIQ